MSVDLQSCRISIGILCFNQRDLIGEVIESARSQTRPADEILVVDDGSSDGSADVARAQGVRVVTHPENRGRAAARTTVLEQATGDIVVYLDGDTLATPQLVETLVALYEGPEVAAVGGVVEETEIANVWDRWRSKHATSRDAGDAPEDVKVLYGWALSCRRELGLEIGGFRPGSEDIDFSLRLRTPTRRLILHPSAKVLHRRSDDWRGINAVVYRFAFGAYVAFAMNGDSRLAPHLRRAIKRAAVNLRHDLVVERDLGTFVATILLFPSQVLGLLRGRRFVAGRLRASLVPAGL